MADLKPQQRKELIEQSAEKSEGNFLYVSFLLNASAKGQRSLCDLEGLPEGLDGLYYQSLERVIELGKQDWHETYAPFMGILSVARTSLTLSQLQAFTQQSESLVWKCLTHLRQFLEEVGRFAESRRIIGIIEDSRERDEALMTLARELTQAQQFTDAKQAIQAIEAPIFEQLEAGLSVSALEEEVRIVGWVRPDWRKVADYF